MSLLKFSCVLKVVFLDFLILNVLLSSFTPIRCVLLLSDDIKKYPLEKNEQFFKEQCRNVYVGRTTKNFIDSFGFSPQLSISVASRKASISYQVLFVQLGISSLILFFRSYAKLNHFHLVNKVLKTIILRIVLYINVSSHSK